LAEVEEVETKRKLKRNTGYLAARSSNSGHVEQLHSSHESKKKRIKLANDVMGSTKIYQYVKARAGPPAKEGLFIHPCE